MEPDRHPFPNVSRKTIQEALAAIEDYLNRFENYFSGSDCDPFRDFSPDSATILLDRLYKAAAYDQLEAEGKIEPGYVHKFANTYLNGRV
jgi:hypothetical protein